jgi:hypothetical protein
MKEITSVCYALMIIKHPSFTRISFQRNNLQSFLHKITSGAAMRMENKKKLHQTVDVVAVKSGDDAKSAPDILLTPHTPSREGKIERIFSHKNSTCIFRVLMRFNINFNAQQTHKRRIIAM